MSSKLMTRIGSTEPKLPAIFAYLREDFKARNIPQIPRELDANFFLDFLRRRKSNCNNQPGQKASRVLFKQRK